MQELDEIGFGVNEQSPLDRMIANQDRIIELFANYVEKEVMEQSEEAMRAQEKAAEKRERESLRDYIAVHAMQAIISQEGVNSTPEGDAVDAKKAYSYADAMLKVRDFP